MNLDGNALLAAIFVSLIGLATFKYGRTQRRVPQTVVGLLLMGFPYFISSVPWVLGIAAGLLAAMALLIRLGV